MEADNEFKLYPMRYVIVIMFAFAQFMVSVVLNTLNPIAAYLRIIYNQD